MYDSFFEHLSAGFRPDSSYAGISEVFAIPVSAPGQLKIRNPFRSSCMIKSDPPLCFHRKVPSDKVRETDNM